MLRKIRNFSFFASFVLAAALVATENTSIPQGIWVSIYLLIPTSVLLVIVSQIIILLQDSREDEKARRLDMRMSAKKADPLGHWPDYYDQDPSSVGHRY